MKIIEENDAEVIYLVGDIDAKNAEDAQKEIVALLSKCKTDVIILDATQLNYISSAGLRILLRARQETGKHFAIRNVSEEIYSVFEMTRFIDLMDISKKE